MYLFVVFFLKKMTAYANLAGKKNHCDLKLKKRQISHIKKKKIRNKKSLRAKHFSDMVEKPKRFFFLFSFLERTQRLKQSDRDRNL